MAEPHMHAGRCALFLPRYLVHFDVAITQLVSDLRKVISVLEGWDKQSLHTLCMCNTDGNFIAFLFCFGFLQNIRLTVHLDKMIFPKV